MRIFSDAGGRRWEVVPGRESWGGIVAIFFPADGSRDLRQAPLLAGGYEEANTELEGLDVEGLRALLARAVPKDVG
jgi:hypothetical protein